MAYVFLTPDWFFGYDILLELFFAFIAFLVSFYAYKVYRISDQRQTKFLSIAFFFISVSYFILAVINFIVAQNLDEQVCGALGLNRVFLLQLFGTYLHALFFIMGLITLAYITFNTKSMSVYFLLLSIVLTSVYYNPVKLFIFYVLSALITGYLIYYYAKAYLSIKKPNVMLMLIAVIFLFLSTVHFIFAINNSLFYFIGHLLELAAYVIILSNLLMVLKHGEKKR